LIFIIRDEIVKNITDKLNEKEKFEFLSKCSMPWIIQDNNHYKFNIHVSKIQENLKTKISQLEFFTKNIYICNNLHGIYH
jgi:hypothetical protein